MLDFHELHKTVNRLVDLSTKLDSNPKKARSRGVFRYIPNNNTIRGLNKSHAESVGRKAPQSELNLYAAISSEKANRLFAHWLRSFVGGNPLDIFSSWQTRDVDNKMYGGGILINHDDLDIEKVEGSCDIFTFSGLYEPVDESIGVIASLEHDLISGISARQIVEFSKNPKYQELSEKFHSI